ncbi:hypothetical protein BpHYR1_039544, partial [Brachionus plicatilis]
MSKKISNFVQKAKLKLTKCIDPSNESSYASVTQINECTPIKSKSLNHETKKLKKSRAKLNLLCQKPLEQSTLNISSLPMLISSPHSEITNNFKQESCYSSKNLFEYSTSSTSDYGSDTQSAFSNAIYESPANKWPSLSRTLNDSIEEDVDISIVEIYICCVAYKAANQSELSTEFMDRFELISKNHYKYNDLCYVRNLSTNQSGYV